MSDVFPGEADLEKAEGYIKEIKKNGDTLHEALSNTFDSSDTQVKGLCRLLFLSLGGSISTWVKLNRKENEHLQVLEQRAEELFGKEKAPAKEPKESKKPATEPKKPAKTAASKAKKPASDAPAVPVQELQNKLQSLESEVTELRKEAQITQQFVVDVHAMMQLYFMSDDKSAAVLNDADCREQVHGKLLKDSPIIEGNG